MDPLHDTTLKLAVELATGNPNAAPRPVQSELSTRIATAMEQTGQVLFEASTGSGKSLAYLVPAALRAVLAGERTVVSTESLSLQAQIFEKDLPVVARAVQRTTGEQVSFAVLKGWGNYACFGPDVEVLTFGGAKRIQELAGTKPLLLDGNGHWVNSEVRDFGEQDIWLLHLRRGKSTTTIETTAEHRWFVQPNANFTSNPKEVTTEHLRTGDPLMYMGPRPRSRGGMKPSTFGIAAGIVFGDGTRYRSPDMGLHPGACAIQLFGEKNWPLARYFNDAPMKMEEAPREGWSETVLRVDGLPSFLKDRPSLSVNTSYLYGWLAGYFAADGWVGKDGVAAFSSADRSNLEFVTTVCAHLGIAHGTISKPTRRKGLNCNQADSELFSLNLMSQTLNESFFLIEEHRKRWLENYGSYKQHRAFRRWKVEGVERMNYRRRVYCAVVPTTNSFTLVGNILTGNCSLDAVSALRAASGADPDAQIPMTPSGLTQLAEKADAAMASVPSGTRVSGKDNALVDAHELAAAASWGVHATAGQRVGDRHSYPEAVAGPVWDAISVSASDCLKDSCPLREWCLPARAKKKASEAQIVVTNHTLLGIQAAKSVPAVMSSRSLGQFHHVVVDEAHGLPGVVRSQGATVISGRRVNHLRSALNRAVEDWTRATGTYLTQVARSVGSSAMAVTADKQAAAAEARGTQMLERVTVGFTVAGDVDRALSTWRSRADRSGVVKLGEQDDPLGPAAVLITDWLADMRKLLKELTPVGFDLSVARAQARTTNRIEALSAAVKTVCKHEVGTARWIERDSRDDCLEAKATPVDIAGALRANVWTTEVIPDDDDQAVSLALLAAEQAIGQSDGTSEPAEVEKVPLSVTCVSATLPRGFTRDAGLATKLARFPSPLGQAYAGSVLHIPKPTAADIVVLSAPFETSRKKFHTPGHAEWSLPRTVELVEANGGSALVLAATAAAGRDYTAALRGSAHGRWQVLSQWDGRLASAVATDWRADHSSVLVGTRSYMTGLDAPGATCSLVVLDRPPRAASNPVDDARVELLVESAQISRWDADRRVYVADAAVLLSQAVGRLLRASEDRGMVAVLDPRLLKNNPFSYQEPTRQAYMATVESFGRKMSDPAAALAWLRAQASSRTQAA